MSKLLRKILLPATAIYFICAYQLVLADDNAASHVETAQKYLSEKNYKGAIGEFSAALSFTMDDKYKSKIVNAIGWAYYSIGESESAMQHLQQAYELASRAGERNVMIRALNNMGLVEFSRGHFAEARKYFEDDLVATGDTAKRYLPLIVEQENLKKANDYISTGVVYRLNKMFTKSIGEFDKALSLVPDNANALEYKGYALYRLGKYDESIATLNRAYELDSSDINISINLLKAYCGKKEPKKSIEFIKSSTVSADDKKALLNDGELKRVCGPEVMDQILALE